MHLMSWFTTSKRLSEHRLSVPYMDKQIPKSYLKDLRRNSQLYVTDLEGSILHMDGVKNIGMR